MHATNSHRPNAPWYSSFCRKGTAKNEISRNQMTEQQKWQTEWTALAQYYSTGQPTNAIPPTKYAVCCDTVFFDIPDQKAHWNAIPFLIKLMLSTIMGEQNTKMYGISPLCVLQPLNVLFVTVTFVKSNRTHLSSVTRTSSLYVFQS